MPNKQTFILKAEKRDEKIKAAALRRQGLIPGVVYGHGFGTAHITVPYNQFVKVHNEASESSLVDLDLGGKEKFKVLIHGLEKHPVTDKVIHFDLYRVKMTEKLETSIDLKFVGESPAIAMSGGTLIKNLDELEVKCLPGDLVSEIQVDLSPLKEFGDVIKVADLKIPTGIEVLNNPDLVVVTVAEPAKEEAEIGAPIEEKVEEIKVEKKGKKEEEGEESEK